MAHLGSTAVAGYFKTPERLLTRLARLVSAPPNSDQTLLDPCCGMGEAAAELRRLWNKADNPPIWRLYGCEIERTRAAASRRCFNHSQDRLFQGDALRLDKDPADAGASVLYLNPPYDSDAEHGRLEVRFLRRFTAMLAPGGVLLYVIPASALEASAETVGRSFERVSVWRFPDPEYADFRQVVVLARRLAVGGRAGEQTLRVAAAAPERLPELPEHPEPLRVVAFSSSLRGLRMASFDAFAAREAYRPGAGLKIGCDLTANDVIGRPVSVAVPVRPAHAALVMAAGTLNGFELRPDPARADGFPPILVKGVFVRRLQEIEKQTDAAGEIVAKLEAETPSLRLTVLRLDTCEFYKPPQGSVPTGAPRLSLANIADIFDVYGADLGRLVARQFVPIHDPAAPANALELPTLARTPWEAQRGPIEAALKLLARGECPQFIAEVGTGKTTMGLYLSAALSPIHHARTSAALRAQGFPRPPRVSRTLVLAPPHLIDSWSDQARAVWPEARVKVLRRISDVWDDAEIYLLSRESAKLGSRVEGLSQCPACGAGVDDPDKAARRRLRCGAEIVPRVVSVRERIAEALAAAIVAAAPETPSARHLVRAHRILRLRAERQPAELTPQPGAHRYRTSHVERSLRDVSRDLWRLMLSEAEEDDYTTLRHLSSAIAYLALALERAEIVRKALETLKEKQGDRPNFLTALRNSIMLLKPESERLGSLVEVPETAAECIAAALRTVLELTDFAEDDDPELCGEPLYQFTASPRRYPLATYIARHARRRFDLVLADEFHEYANSGSAQSIAAQRLMSLGIPVVPLSGSFNSGYASSLFNVLSGIAPDFRQDFGRKERSRFIEAYGLRKYRTSWKTPKSSERGAVSDRRIQTTSAAGEAPGFVPSLLVDYVLPRAIVVQKADLDDVLPKMEERLVPIHAETSEDRAILAEGMRGCHLLAKHIHRDRWTPLVNKLWGALGEVPSYLDRCTEDHGPFELGYPESAVEQELIPENQRIVFSAKMEPADRRTPKERWLLRELRAQLDRGRKCLVFVRHTRGRLPHRLLEMIQRSVSAQALFLDVNKVSAPRRERWIDTHVNAKDIKVLIVNHKAVSTGLNNLVGFSTAIHYESDYDARIYRQVNGRIHRPGQTQNVEILVPFYAGTPQEVAVHLIARKVGASERFDALDIAGALEACGCGTEEDLAVSLNLTQAIYESLTGDAAMGEGSIAA